MIKKSTHAPLPSFNSLTAALYKKRFLDNKLAAPWCRPGNTSFWLSRSAWSLALIAEYRKQITGEQIINVWVPDFICNTSLQPLREIGAKLLFYPINNDMTPDIKACQILTKENNLDIFIAVHYFGRPTPMTKIAEFCKTQKAWLIEDAAHILRPIPGVGELGDFILYSPHKHLPIPNGAVLIIHKNGPSCLTDKEFNVLFQKMLNKPNYSLSPSLMWLIKRILQKFGVRPSANSIFTDNTPAYLKLGHPKMSNISKHLLSNMLDTIDEAACLRKQNKEKWSQILSKIIPLATPVLNKNDPYLAEFSFKDMSFAEETFKQCQNMNFPVTTWPDLPPEVLNQINKHKTAIFIRNTRIYLSTHQTLNLSDFIK